MNNFKGFLLPRLRECVFDRRAALCRDLSEMQMISKQSVNWEIMGENGGNLLTV